MRLVRRRRGTFGHTVEGRRDGDGEELETMIQNSNSGKKTSDSMTAKTQGWSNSPAQHGTSL
jgi:hypothetical protein